MKLECLQFFRELQANAPQDDEAYARYVQQAVAGLENRTDWGGRIRYSLCSWVEGHGKIAARRQEVRRQIQGEYEAFAAQAGG